MPLIFDEAWLRDYEKRTGKGVQGEGRPHQSAAPTASPEGKPRWGDDPSSVSLRSTASPEGKPRGTADGKRPKYGNVKVTNEDGTFDSKHEALMWADLKLKAKAGMIISLARQVRFYLPGGVVYVADFVVRYKDGREDVMDAKSEATRQDKVYRMKKKLMRECLGIEIKEV